jgi:hypothetical protein
VPVDRTRARSLYGTDLVERSLQLATNVGRTKPQREPSVGGKQAVTRLVALLLFG